MILRLTKDIEREQSYPILEGTLFIEDGDTFYAFDPIYGREIRLPKEQLQDPVYQEFFEEVSANVV